MIDIWGPTHLEQLLEIARVALPHEELTSDELSACLFGEGTIVLGDETSQCAAAASLREQEDRRTAHVQFLAVHPGERRLGRASSLLHEIQAWARDRGAETLELGAAAPFYLWPGVDVRWTPAMCFAEAAGFAATGAELNLSCATTFRAAAPEGIQVRRATSEADAGAVVELGRRHWPWWVPEVERGIDHASTFGAFVDGAAVGFACHSVNRIGWIGPMAVDRGHGRQGIGSALLSELCRDLMVAGVRDAEIAWVGTISFYAKAAGAAVSRVFRSFAVDLG